MRIEVLMSTYNGEKYIAEQIDSILSQSVQAHITIRDDGSSDSTLEIIKNYPEIALISGENVGSTESFLTLIDEAPESDYYAFSDQDDVWDNDKLELAISSLDSYTEVPAIYSGNTRLVNEKLQYIGDETLEPRTTLGSAIVKNYATGCTIVFNKKLMSYLKQYRPQRIPYHDWWANLVCLSVGGVSLYDYLPHMSYRQHSENVVGVANSKWGKWKRRLKKFSSVRYHRELMAEQILCAYGTIINEKNRSILDDCAEQHVNMNKEFKTGNLIDDLLFRFCGLMKRL